MVIKHPFNLHSIVFYLREDVLDKSIYLLLILSVLIPIGYDKAKIHTNHHRDDLKSEVEKVFHE